jgi:hypothetical protein
VLGTRPGPPILIAEIRAHCEMIHTLAAPLAGQGKLVIGCFGEDPGRLNPKTGALGCPLAPRVVHVEIGAIEATDRTVADLTVGEHRNVYMSLAVFRSDLRKRRKGFEKDIVAVLGLVADFDDTDAARWAERLPLPPNFVLETSAGRFQAFYLFDKPEALAIGKLIAARLKAYAACDHGTADLSHVWRIAGTLNWPNAKKVGAGRPREPQTVRVVRPWQGDRVSLADLAVALSATEKKPNGAGSADVSIELILKLLPPKLRARITDPAGDRSKAVFHVVRALIARDVDDVTIEHVIQAHPNGVGAKYVGRSDLAKEIARIRSKASEPAASAADPLSALIDEFNSQYAVVNEAGIAIVYERVIDPLLQRSILVRITFADLKKFYLNRPVTVRVEGSEFKTKTAAEWWLRHPKRRQYLGGVVLDPTGNAPEDRWNLWSGFSVRPAPGDWSLMHDHVLRVICAGDKALSDYLFDWVARMFQYPGKLGEVAIVLRGKKGAGKGILFNWIVRAWGQHGIHITHAKHLIGNFNAHLRDCVALFTDEAFFAGDKQHEGVLKGLITEPTLPIEGKFQNVVEVLNLLHVMMASNSDWVIPASQDERRFFVLDVADHRIGQREYFTGIAEQMERGGLAAMIHDMLRRDITGFDVRDVPSTAALRDQKIHSLDSLYRWWLAVLDRGFVWKSQHGSKVFQKWTDFYSTELLWRSYLQWCDETHPFDRKSRTQLGKMMTDIYVAKRPGSREETSALRDTHGRQGGRSHRLRRTSYRIRDLRPSNGAREVHRNL